MKQQVSGLTTQLDRAKKEITSLEKQVAKDKIEISHLAKWGDDVVKYACEKIYDLKKQVHEAKQEVTGLNARMDKTRAKNTALL